MSKLLQILVKTHAQSVRYFEKIVMLRILIKLIVFYAKHNQN